MPGQEGVIFGFCGENGHKISPLFNMASKSNILLTTENQIFNDLSKHAYYSGCLGLFVKKLTSHTATAISQQKLFNKSWVGGLKCHQFIKIRVDHREGRVFISFTCHCQVTVMMGFKKNVGKNVWARAHGPL